jgi:hypothetical protein
LCNANQLAEAVTNMDGGWDPVKEEISRVWQNGGKSSAHRIALHQRAVTHPDTSYIGNGVVGTRTK